MTSERLGLRGRIDAAVARWIGRLPPRVALRLAGGRAVTVEGQTLDPHVQLSRAVRRLRNRHGLCEPNVAAGRTRYRYETRVFQWPRTPVGRTDDLTLPGPGGGIPARLYFPEGATRPPLTVYLHGGGYTIGGLDTSDEPCRILCREARVAVLSVDYRLAPEHPFPAALDDARAALRWAQAHAAELGADPQRVAMGGDSAGANLATVTALETRGQSPPAAQLLIYPPTDEDRERPSHTLFGAGYFLDAGDRSAFARCYLEGCGVTATDPRVSPLRTPDLTGAAPAMVVTAGFDILRDEGIAYAEALAAAGVTVDRVHLP